MGSASNYLDSRDDVDGPAKPSFFEVATHTIGLDAPLDILISRDEFDRLDRIEGEVVLNTGINPQRKSEVLLVSEIQETFVDRFESISIALETGDTSSMH